MNAITKSGTNIVAGTFSGYFRDDKFIAQDFVQNRVLPYQNQQVSATFGGPIMRDRVHFFANYEYEREPQTFSLSSPYPELQLRPERHAHGVEGRRPRRLPVHARRRA